MKRFLNCVPALCTVFILGVGLFMPRFASLALDRRLEREIVQRENSAVSLSANRERDFFETLELFEAGNTQVELSAGEYMSAEEAEAAAMETMRELAASGRVYTTPKVTPVLITSREIPDVSGVFWCCVWSDARSMGEVLWLDDQSGKMVALQGRVGTPETSKEAYVSTLDPVFQDSAVRLAEFLRLHYPVDNVKLALGEEDGGYTVALLRETEGGVVIRELSLRLGGEWLYFNL